MSDGIVAGGTREPLPSRRLVPMQVGNATVYVEQMEEPAEVEVDARIYPVSPRIPNPTEAFETASEALRECVRVLGGEVEALAEQAKPDEITVEFGLSFEAKGKAQLIPVFLTGETKGQVGLKVTAVWGTGG